MEKLLTKQNKCDGSTSETERDFQSKWKKKIVTRDSLQYVLLVSGFFHSSSLDSVFMVFVHPLNQLSNDFNLNYSYSPCRTAHHNTVVLFKSTSFVIRCCIVLCNVTHTIYRVSYIVLIHSGYTHAKLCTHSDAAPNHKCCRFE